MSTQTCTKCGGEDDSSSTMCSACGTPYPVPDPNDAPEIRKGQLIANRYVILDRIGQGGMGCIYKVQDNTLGEVVALKTLLPAYVKDKIVVERFFNEARIARGLSHPHIVRVHDIGIADDIVYISMELLPGRTLRSMLDKMMEGRRIPLNAILRMFDALCAALEYAHTYTVHRDIKPENVMVLPDGSVKLMDFGISKLMSNPNMTSASMVMGTPHYMSPEQLKSSADVDGRADIYSVGVMLYEALTGSVPTGIGQRSKIQSTIPPALSPIVLKCCQHDPLQRYQKVSELRQALRAVRKEFETGSSSSEESSTPAPLAAGIPSISTPSVFGRKAVAIAVVIALSGGAFLAERWANARRMAVLEHAVVLANTPEELSVASTPPRPKADTFSQMRPLLQSAKRKAQAFALAQPNDARLQALLAEANGFVETAKTLDEGWLVLDRYFAILRWSANMELIPGGEVQYYTFEGPVTEILPAFLMDTQEISVAQFRRFSEVHDWRIHPDTQGAPGNNPMTLVTYYDADACLKNQQPAKKLPTPAQFVQAVVHIKAQLDSAALLPVTDPSDDEPETTPHAALTWIPDNFYEWTRMKQEDRAPEGLIGFSIPIMTAHVVGEDHAVGPMATLAYERFYRSVGFRGVLEMPRTLAQAQAWLSSDR